MAKYSKKFLQLYDAYFPNIYRFIRLKSPTEEIAQDVTSETFLKAWKALQEGGVWPDNERAYLYKIASHCIADYYRGGKREVLIGDEQMIDYFDQRTADAPEVGDTIDKNENIGKIYTALRTMSDVNANLVILKHVEDLSHAEIGQILGKSEGAVRTALSRAMEELREKLENV